MFANENILSIAALKAEIAIMSQTLRNTDY